MNAVIRPKEEDAAPYPKAWVQETVRSALLEAILADVPVAREKIDVRVKPGFGTACWAYLPPHRVYVGDGIAHRARKELSDEQHKRYVTNYVFHEFAHALKTDRDLKTINEELKDLAPFSLFNLFEDARIEHWYRETYNHQFNWTMFEEVTLSPDDATSILFAFIQYEGDAEAVLQHARDAIVADELVAEVQSFYLRAIEVEGSRDLYPILEDWIKRFGVPPNRSGNGLEDLSLSLELQANPEAREEFEHETVSVNGAKPLNAKGHGNAEAGSVEVEKTEGNAELLVDEECELSMERVRRVADRFERFFAGEVRQVSTDAPTRRISVRNFVAGKPCYRRKELKARQRRQVLLVIDCSGSMGGYHIEEGRVLVAALSELARRGAVSGHVVLSCVLGEEACWQKFTLPMSPSSIRRIEAYGQAEGLEFSLQENLKEAKAADYVFVYTDGRISDAPINKRLLHSRGIYTWGLYAGDSHVLFELTRYFDKVILRSDAERLVEAMLVHA